MQRQAYPISILVEAVRQQCAGRLEQELVGPYEGVAVRSIGALSHAKPDEVAFLANPKRALWCFAKKIKKRFMARRRLARW